MYPGMSFRLATAQPISLVVLQTHLRIMAIFIKIAVYAYRYVFIMFFFISKTDNSEFKSRVSVLVSTPHPGASAQIFTVRVLRTSHGPYEAPLLQPDASAHPSELFCTVSDHFTGGTPTSARYLL